MDGAPALPGRRRASIRIAAAACALAGGPLGLPALAAAPGARAPELTRTDADSWVNSPPLTLASLRGRVVLIDFWTFDCWNCYRSFPWLNGLERRFEHAPFTVVGIHSPEFEHERDIERVRAKIRAFGLTHAVMVDNDLAYWRAMGNRYWPAFYLVDKKGYVRHVFVGETHAGDPRAQRIEAAITALLAES